MAEEETIKINLLAEDQASHVMQNVEDAIDEVSVSSEQLSETSGDIRDNLIEMGDRAFALEDVLDHLGMTTEEFSESMDVAKEAGEMSADVYGVMERAVHKLNSETMIGRDVFKQSHDEWARGQELGVEFSNTFARFASNIRMVIQGMQGFRFEALSALFAGMQLQRMATNLLTPAFELAGIFELFGTILELLFLPAALSVLDWVIDLLNWVTELDEETKMFLGLLVVGIGIFGALTFALSMLNMVLSGSWALLAPLAALFGVVLIIIGILEGNLYLLAIGIGVVAVALMFMTAAAAKIIIIILAIIVVVALLYKHWDTIWPAMQKGFESFVHAIGESMNILLNTVLWPFIKTIDIIMAGVEKLTGQTMPRLGESLQDVADGMRDYEIAVDDATDETDVGEESFMGGLFGGMGAGDATFQDIDIHKMDVNPMEAEQLTSEELIEKNLKDMEKKDSRRL